jgi:hypothetical protein
MCCVAMVAGPSPAGEEHKGNRAQPAA